MFEHVVEFFDDEWRVLASGLRAHSPFQAVIKAADAEGSYRARRSGASLDQSEHFWVPAWGQPIALEAPCLR